MNRFGAKFVEEAAHREDGQDMRIKRKRDMAETSRPSGSRLEILFLREPSVLCRSDAVGPQF
jgi:hypothetical protein